MYTFMKGEMHSERDVSAMVLLSDKSADFPPFSLGNLARFRLRRATRRFRQAKYFKHPAALDIYATCDMADC